MTTWRLLLAAGAICGALLGGAAIAVDVDAAPSWVSLTAAQKQTLAPLERDWAGIDANRKQKWLALAARLPTLPADERQRVQQRMAGWANLTPVERARARMQFQEASQWPAEERQARWHQYQALSDGEKSTLAQRAKPPLRAPSSADAGAKRASADAGTAKRNMVLAPPTAPGRAVAPTVVQAKPGATTTTMSTRVAPPNHTQTGLPKIAATPGFVDATTLLPRRGPQGAAVRAAAATDPTAQP